MGESMGVSMRDRTAGSHRDAAPARLMHSMLRHSNGVPRSLPAFLFLALVSMLGTFFVAVAPELASPFAGLLVPAAVIAAAVGALVFSGGLERLRAICAALFLLAAATPTGPPPRDRRPSGLADRCRRVEATLLAGPRAPGAAA